MSIKHRIKFRSDRDRGTSSAVLRSSGPKRQATTLGVSGESVRRDVPADDNEYRSGGAYRAILKLFAENLKNENDT
tara:strand:- start:52 stop:279 length:228 start_codon:yes stop_codon:yes gene_type:complete